jgi:HK97 family phage major capsid protein
MTAVINSGNVYTCPNGETASITYQDILALEHSVDASYRLNGSWMFSDKMLKVIKGLVDENGRPLWLPALTGSFQKVATVGNGPMTPTIMGRPFLVNNDLAVPAASAYTMLFGDF